MLRYQTKVANYLKPSNCTTIKKMNGFIPKKSLNLQTRKGYLMAKELILVKILKL